MILRKLIFSNMSYKCFIFFLHSNRCIKRYLFPLSHITLRDIYFKNHRKLLSLHGFNSYSKFNYSQSVSLEVIQHSVDTLISDNPDVFSDIDKNELYKIVTFIFSKGYSLADIREKFLSYLNKECSYLKFTSLNEIDPDILPLLPLLSLSSFRLKLVVNQCRSDIKYINGFSNRIEYLSHHLEIPLNELIPALAKHSALLTMRFERLHRRMEILKNANISPKYIVKDLWIFNYNEALLASRIQAAVDAGIQLKPWILRCDEKVFESMLVRCSETHRILNGVDEVTYLAKKLDCNEDYVEHMMERNKLLKSINIPKLDKVLNFLFEKGYTPQEIRLFPRVFCSSVQTLNQRFEEYRSLKDTLPTISQLCMSTIKLKNSSLKKSSKTKAVQDSRKSTKINHAK